MENLAPHAETPRQEGGTARLEAFSDGVFAIAITLLVLDLKVPSNLSPITPHTLTAALVSKWPNYLTLLISFATILIMWVYHHNLFKAAKKPELPLLFSNGLLLLLVTVVPFPTALVGAFLTTPAASVACAIYAGFFALVDSAFNLLWWAVSRQQPGGRLQARRFSTSMLISLLGLPCYLIATAVAFWSPLLTLFICAALWVVWATTLPRLGNGPVSAKLTKRYLDFAHFKERNKQK
jgi:uncharacterized membrane protein